MWIEVIFISIILLLFVWLLLLLISKWKLRKLKKNYDGEKDLSKKGESRTEYGKRKGTGRSEKSESDFAGQDEPERRGILQTTDNLPVRKNSKSTGIRRIRKLRRRK